VKTDNKNGKGIIYYTVKFMPWLLSTAMIIAVMVLIINHYYKGYQREPSSPEEIELSRYVPGESDHCPYTGEIVRIEDLIGSNETLGGSGLIVVQVQPDPPIAGKHLAAIASKHDNFSVGDRIDLCRVMVSHMHGFNTNLKSILITRKIPNYSYENPGVQTLERCQVELKYSQDDLEECSENLEICFGEMVVCREKLKHSPEKICDDGVDNDWDGYTDCKDHDCKKDPACKCLDSSIELNAPSNLHDK